jgi:ribosomal protein L37E
VTAYLLRAMRYGVRFELEGDGWIRVHKPERLPGEAREILAFLREHPGEVFIVLRRAKTERCLRCGAETLHLPSGEMVDNFEKLICTACGFPHYHRDFPDEDYCPMATKDGLAWCSVEVDRLLIETLRKLGIELWLRDGELRWRGAGDALLNRFIAEHAERIKRWLRLEAKN